MRTLPFVAGSASAAAHMSERVELLKWLGMALMLVDHVGRFWGVHVPAWQVLGRGAFPLFALAFGYALSVVPDARSLLLRLVACGLLAEVLGAWSLTKGWPVNVLFTFAACTYLLHRLRCARSPWAMIWPSVVVFLVSPAFEFGLAGVALVLAAWWYFARPSWRGAVAVCLAGVLLVGINGDWFGTVWCGLGLLVLRLPLGLPRVRRAFYVGYVAQWPVLWVFA